MDAKTGATFKMSFTHFTTGNRNSLGVRRNSACPAALLKTFSNRSEPIGVATKASKRIAFASAVLTKAARNDNRQW